MRRGAVQPVEVTDLVTDLQRLAARLDPDAITDADVDGMVIDLGQALRLVQGMLTLLARRLAEIRADQPSGPAGAAAALADATGTTEADARRRLGTSKRLADQDRVADAVRNGRLSDGQTVAVTDAVAANPDAEADLLDAAGSQSLTDLRRTCRDTKAKSRPRS